MDGGRLLSVVVVVLGWQRDRGMNGDGRICFSKGIVLLDLLMVHHIGGLKDTKGLACYDGVEMGIDKDVITIWNCSVLMQMPLLSGGRDMSLCM